MILEKLKKHSLKNLILTLNIEYIINFKYNNIKKIVLSIFILFIIISFNTCTLFKSQYRIYKTKLNNVYNGQSIFIKNTLKKNSIEYSSNYESFLKGNGKKYILLKNGLDKIIRIDSESEYLFFQTDILKEYITSYKSKSFNKYDIFVITTDKNIYIRVENKDFNITKNDVNKNVKNNYNDSKNNIENKKFPSDIWVRLDKEKIRNVDYITSADIININNIYILFVGTSFGGLYYKAIFDNDLNLKNSKFKLITDYIKRVSFTSNNSKFFEQISSIVSYKNMLFIGYGYGKGVDVLKLYEISGNNEKKDVNFDNLKDNYLLKNKYYIDIEILSNIKKKIELGNNILAIYNDTNINIDEKKLESVKKIFIENNYIFVETTKGLYRNLVKNLEGHFAIKNNTKSIDSKKNEDNSSSNEWTLVYKDLNKEIPKYKKDNIKGVYLPPSKVSSKDKIIKQFDVLKSLGINAVVIDFKDDFGNINYLSDVKTANLIKATRNLIDLDFLIKYAKKTDIKIIARLVSFKDPKLFSFDNNKYAFIDKTTKKAWIGLPKERWVDPASLFVQNYLIDIAKELSSKGIYEIQFDYIRYPSDGKTSNIISKFNKNNYSKNGILYSFLKNAKKHLKIPISTDFYGYQCFYKISSHIGQDLYLLSDFINAIYPMYYPSHFSNGFYQKGIPQEETNYYIYNHGVKRAYQITNNKIFVRPWVQAFKWKVNINYIKYIQSQIDGLKDAGVNSFIFWNPSGNYTILEQINF